MSNYSKQLEVGSNGGVAQDRSNKWCVPLKNEGVFLTFMANKGNHHPVVHKVFGADGSLFSPLLFGKFFDPSDAFPLWEFEPGELLSAHQQIPGMIMRSKIMVDWFQTNMHYVLKAQLPASLVENDNLQICIENGKVLEISGQWRQQGEQYSKTEDWKSSHWWEHGFVRRLELPENVDWKKIEAYVNDGMVLEIRMPKNIIIELVIPQVWRTDEACPVRSNLQRSGVLLLEICKTRSRNKRRYGSEEVTGAMEYLTTTHDSLLLYDMNPGIAIHYPSLPLTSLQAITHQPLPTNGYRARPELGLTG